MSENPRKFNSETYKDYQKVRERESFEEPRPWNIIEVVRNSLPGSESQLLDAGCGEALKLIELIEKNPDLSVTGFDITRELLLRAKSNKKSAGVDQVGLAQSDIEYVFPFPEESFDTVTFMLSRHNAPETFRVLKPGGIVILERVGEQDKREIKDLFGNGVDGKPRGYLNEIPPGGLSDIYNQDFEKAGFSDVQVEEGFWRTWVPKQKFISLLENTPFILDFDIEKDGTIVNEIERKFGSPQGISFIQHRILLVATK